MSQLIEIKGRKYQVTFDAPGQPGTVSVCCQPKGAAYTFSTRLLWERGRPVRGVVAKVLRSTHSGEVKP
jgi:hypothetical protein